ncbi:hypothetical protein [Sulfuricurvum sp.]|uniref:hypothetical protein n=1 Tax=Sulfuricurvum sp. TaxID=2025608 RepID=UPI003BAE9763
MSKIVKVIGLGGSALVLAGLFGLDALAVELKNKPLAPMQKMDQERHMVNTMRQLGFAVESVTQKGNGVWEVRVNGFDSRKASGTFRGAIIAPSTTIRGGQNAAMAGKSGMSGRGGAMGPKGGGLASDQDGSATGGGSGGSDGNSAHGNGGLFGDDNTGGSGNGGLLGDDNTGGGSATGGGKAALQVSVSPDGSMVINADSLRKAGFANTLKSTANGQVNFR